MSLSQEQRILSLLLLLAIGGLAAAHTSSFEPRLGSGLKSGSANLSQIIPSAKLSRAKRVAIYNGQGVVKFAVTVAHPVKQVEKEQSFWFFYNLQSQYIPTTVPIFWWSFWNTTTFVSTARQLRKGMQATLHRDDTRSWVYDALEVGMAALDGSESGATCLLRSICEVSQLPFENSNIFSEIVNAVLIPTADNVAEKYINARDAGRAGADCQKTYKDCSRKTWNWLTNFNKVNF